MTVTCQAYDDDNDFRHLDYDLLCSITENDLEDVYTFEPVYTFHFEKNGKLLFISVFTKKYPQAFNDPNYFKNADVIKKIIEDEKNECR